MTYIFFEALQRKLESIVTSMCRDIKIDQINLGVADKLYLDLKCISLLKLQFWDVYIRHIFLK